MMNKILNHDLQTYRLQIDEIVKDLHELTIEIGHTDLKDTVSDLRSRIKEPFMFVIVGEVKAGKSSFINALLSTGKEICKVAPQPMTDTIQQLIYGEKEEVITLNPYLKKIMQPVEILKEIAIVDTPGTNAIVEHHQEITERFIPASDLIVFVFEAKNPYRQSAWDFFDFIHTDWRKKIIFILQQKDLMNESDLAVNINGVKEYAAKKGINDPTVFAVSAKQEMEGLEQESGYLPVREYIRDNITGGKAPVLKLQNNVATSQNISERITQGVNLRIRQYDADVNFRKEVTETLIAQEGKSKYQVGVLVENLLNGYDRITKQKEEELSSGLSAFSMIKRSFASIFSKKTSTKDWLENLPGELEKDLKLELQNKLQLGITDLADSIQQMAKMIDLKIQNSKTILKDDHAIFANIAERRANVMRDLQAEFSDFMQHTDNFRDASLFSDSQPITQNVLTGSGIAAVGAILATVTQGAVFDITGGVLTTIGLLFAGIASTSQKRKVMTGFQEEIAKGRGLMETEVSQKLNRYVTTIKKKIDDNFEKFDAMLELEEKKIGGLEEEVASINVRLGELEEKLNG
ncbi:MAG: GTPase SAR1 family protein [Paraglaciecola sp.]|jgi:GTPase SAR1 family protein